MDRLILNNGIIRFEISRVLYVACAHIEEGSMVGLEVGILDMNRILVLSDLTRKLKNCKEMCHT